MLAAGQRSLHNTVLTRSVGPLRSTPITSCRAAAAAAAAAAAKMTSGSSSSDPGANPKVVKIRELIGSGGPAGGWEKCWEEGVTPWDLGMPTPVVQHLLETRNLPKGRVLIPGCGTGYDVVAIASPERYVVGLEISASAIKKTIEWSSSLPNANYFSFLLADFFTWQPTELFDLVFDYTFFCAIDPCMRPAWAQKIRDMLKPDGELITLMFPIGDHAGGPPYNVSVDAYREVLIPLGFKAISIVDNELAINARKGREKLGRWKRCPNRSLL